MSRSNDPPCPCAHGLEPGGAPAERTLDAAQPPAVPHRVLLLDTDAALIAMIDEWLAAEGCVLVPEPAGRGAPMPGCDLAIVDLPFAREGGDERVRQIAREQPGTPIVALSAAFFPGVATCGSVARALGVNCVLAKPATRQALTQAVRRLLAR